jgi:hypothetical protein
MDKSNLRNLYLNEFVKELIEKSLNNQESARIEQPVEIMQVIENNQESLKQENPEEKQEIIDQLIDLLEEDAEIEKIECPGPDKTLIMIKNNNINQTSFSFNNEEIEEIIENMAKKANISLDQGIISAKIGNWSFIGIISEFGGSRFTIQKAD